ncbi:MAG: helix-turn-helix transcriptional regulator [Paludibacter sp.]|nr:helix-turn-helix transcriptional regulator [Paludibacter sp.]
MKLKVIIEQNSKGHYSAYIDDENINFGILGEGKSVEATIEDFKIGVEEMRETYQILGREFPDVEFNFMYDTSSFLSSYSQIMSLAGMSRLTGINQGLLSHYVTGRKKPRKETVDKICTSVHTFGKLLCQLELI